MPLPTRLLYTATAVEGWFRKDAESKGRGGQAFARFQEQVTQHRRNPCILYANLRESGKPTAAQVSELLAENIVFNSPILVRPIEGREVIAAIFAQSSATRGSGTYTAEFKLDERTTFLRWVGTMDGHKFESLEVIVDNEQGLIVERTLALRPYPALKLFRDAMYASLKDKLPPDVWDYPTP
jgi:hypothetical protein